MTLSFLYYDSFGQLVRENNKSLDKTFIYSYNGIGNITAVKTYDYILADNVSDDGYNSIVEYEYSGDKLTNFNGKVITYNSIGYPTDYDNKTWTWTDGRLARIYRGSQNQAESRYESCRFTYDGYGRRIGKNYIFDKNTSSTVDLAFTYSTDYEYDNGGRIVHEHCTETTNGSTTNTRDITYLYDEASMVGAIQNYNGVTETYFFDRNIRGDVVGIYNSAGTKVASYAYDAWGNCTTKTLVANNFSSYNPIRYRGYYYDRETGLYYLNARYYNPEWRRFISPDSTEYIDPETPNGLNLYAYCNNDPVNYADPSGHSLTAILVSAFIIGSAVSAGISVASQLIENDYNWNKIDPWLVFSDAMFGGVNGLLAASGIGALGSAFLGASLGALQLATSSAITGKKFTAVDFWVTTALGFIGGFIPKAGINARQVSSKINVFKTHIKMPINSRRYIMYSNKLSELTKDVILCGSIYVASTVVTAIASDHISNNMER